MVILFLTICYLLLITFSIDYRGNLYYWITLAIIILTIVLEIITIIVKINVGENTVFNFIMLPIQAINLISLSMSLIAYKLRNKKDKHKCENVIDIVV